MSTSFRDMRNARASRQTKSYVSQSNLVHLAHPTAAPVEPIREPVEGKEMKDEAGATCTDGTSPMGVDSENVKIDSKESAMVSAAKKTEDSAAALKGWYADLPPMLAIKKSKKRGRGIWTKEAVKGGECSRPGFAEYD